MIRVSGASMEKSLSSCMEMSDVIRGDFRTLQTDFGAIAGSWEGEAAEAFFGRLEEGMEGLRRDCTRMQILLAGLAQAMCIYSACEKQMEEYVQS